MNFPVEVLEPILIKAVAAFRNVYGAYLLQRVDVSSLLKVSFVCRYWSFICDDPSNRRRIRDIFRQKVNATVLLSCTSDSN
jgi:hypothetical protein